MPHILWVCHACVNHKEVAGASLTLTPTPCRAAITYLMLTLFALRKLYQVRSASGVWDTTSFFVGSVLFACLVRTFAFASLCALALKDVTISTESSITTNNVNIFYGKVRSAVYRGGGRGWGIQRDCEREASQREVSRGRRAGTGKRASSRCHTAASPAERESESSEPHTAALQLT